MGDWRAVDLGSLHVSSAVNHDHDGFVQISARGGPDGDVVLLGQVTPGQAREQALVFMRAAEAAEHDAAVVEQLASAGLGGDVIAGFVADLRRRRTEGR